MGPYVVLGFHLVNGALMAQLYCQVAGRLASVRGVPRFDVLYRRFDNPLLPLHANDEPVVAINPKWIHSEYFADEAFSVSLFTIMNVGCCWWLVVVVVVAVVAVCLLLLDVMVMDSEV